MRSFSLVVLLCLSRLAFGQSSVNLTWTASTTANTTVNVYRASSSCSAPFVMIASGVPAGGPYIAGNLINGGTYAFQVTAVVPGGVESGPSNCIVIPIPLPTPPSAPAAPTGLSGTVIPR